MKILFITNGYPPHRWAGTETYTAGIAEELARRGNRVTVLCIGEWEAGSNYWNGYRDEEREAVRIRRLDLDWRKSPDPSRYLYDNPVVANHLVTFLDEIQPHLVHVTSCETLSASVIPTVKNAGLPLLLSLTDFWFLCPRITLLRSDGENCDGNTTPWECLQCQLRGSPMYRWPSQVIGEKAAGKLLTAMSRHPAFTRQRGLRGMAGDMEKRKTFLMQVLELADLRLTASLFVRDVYLQNGVNKPIEIHPYGHDLSWLKNYAGKMPSDVIRFGFIGQIIHSKGVHLLLEAARTLWSAGESAFRIVVYGNLAKEPQYSRTLQELSQDLPNVHFQGTYAHEDSGRVFEDIDVLVVPSLWYDFPLIIHEAFATKTPVIATAIGGMAEAVDHGNTGLVFERGNAADLAAQMLRLIREPAILTQMQARIPSIRTIKDEVDELETIYGELCSSKLVDTKYLLGEVQ
jgi:glycosyltransferase involved in cell wall biosynthesis